MVCEPITINYYFIFFPSRILFFFAVSNFTAGFMGLWNEEMKYETNVIAMVT
jgi:hypothetical protein